MSNGSGSAWEREALSLKQIPTLQALLRCCDEALLVRVIVDVHVSRAGDWDALPSKRKRAVEKRLAATVATMRGLPVSKKHKQASLLLPNESFVLHARSGLIERRVGAAMASLDDVRSARRALKAWEGDGLGVDAMAAPWDILEPHPRRYTLAPWEQTLGSRVWLGGPWCCRERYLVLAGAFWEMTYFGFEYERACARQAEEKTRRLLEADVSNTVEDALQPEDSKSCTASEERERKAAAFGLVEPDRFERDYRESLAAYVDRLNRDGRRAFWMLLLDVARRLDRT